jgi:hypothetical protein
VGCLACLRFSASSAGQRGLSATPKRQRPTINSQPTKHTSRPRLSTMFSSLRSPSSSNAGRIATRKEKSKSKALPVRIDNKNVPAEKQSSLINPGSQHSDISSDSAARRTRVVTFQGRGSLSKDSTRTNVSKPRARCVSFKAPACSNRQKFSARDESQPSDSASDPASLAFTECSQSESVAGDHSECPSESLESGSRHLRASMKLVELLSLYDELEEDF